MSTFTRFTSNVGIEYALEESQELGRDIWRVTTEFRYYIGEEDSDKWVHVPRGYLTDGASSPRALWSIVPPWGSYGQAVIVHDILCEYLSVTLVGLPHKISRMEADRILQEAMEVLGVPASLKDKINLAVQGYREVNRINKAVWHADKARLEAAWAAKHEFN
jgi:hypothetical protein